MQQGAASDESEQRNDSQVQKWSALVEEDRFHGGMMDGVVWGLHEEGNVSSILCLSGLTEGAVQKIYTIIWPFTHL